MISSIFAGLIYYAFLQIKNSRKVNLSMGFSHFGIAVMILGIGLVSSLESQKELIAFKEKPFELENYKITYLGEEKSIAKNFSSDEVSFKVKNLNKEFNLIAEKRYYPVSKSIMTEAAIYPSIKEDLYISIGEQVEEGWVVKAQLKPFVRLIWLGALIMAFGGFLSLFRFKSL
jgi:cytochrome c-type biogenesis protein CcmF